MSLYIISILVLLVIVFLIVFNVRAASSSDKKRNEAGSPARSDKEKTDNSSKKTADRTESAGKPETLDIPEPPRRPERAWEPEPGRRPQPAAQRRDQPSQQHSIEDDEYRRALRQFYRGKDNAEADEQEKRNPDENFRQALRAMKKDD
jgi:hypothetical protein